MNARTLSSRTPRPGFMLCARARATTIVEALVVCLAIGIWTAGYAVLCPLAPSHAPHRLALVVHADA